MRKCISGWVLAVALLARVAWAEPGERDFAPKFRQAAAALLDGLEPAQASALLRPFDKKERWEIRYTGGVRGGIPLKDLPPKSRAAMEDLMKMVLSPYGWEQVQLVAKQNGPAGLGQYYVAFFGDPRQGSDFAWRIAEHHLTILHMEVAQGDVSEFGPILLGADPPALWRAEEEQLMALWRALGTNAAAGLAKGRGIASEPQQPSVAAPVRDLGTAAAQSLDAIWEGRMKLFSDPVRARIERLVAAHGGRNALRMSFYNMPADKRCIDGGRWDWKLGADDFLMDFETSRGHIHMSLWVR